jgi:ligand-binding sensor domain-containing protein
MGLRKLSPRSVIALAAVVGLLAAAVWLVLFLAGVGPGEDLDRVVVEETELFPPEQAGVALWLPGAVALDVEPFDGRVYAATEAGLVAYEPDGRLARRYTTLDGLPENALTCLERYEGRLYVGTRESGLLAFDGSRFTQYRFVRPEARRVTALRAAGGELLVGTFDAGLFEFDGGGFARRRAAEAGDACRQVTALLADGSRVYAGTFGDGLFAWREGRVDRIGPAEGLPSRRVTGLASRGGAVLVATDLGVAELGGDGRATVVAAAPNVTAVAAGASDAWTASLTQGVAALPQTGLTLRAVADSLGLGGGPAVAGLPPGGALNLEVEDGVLWAMTSAGLFACEAPGAGARFEPFGAPAHTGLSAGHVAALAVDARGRLWVGYFDGGIDVLDPATGERLERVEDPDLWEVNAILAEPDRERVWVASSVGLATFDNGRKTRLLGERDGLVGANVAGVAGGGPGADLAVATNKGVSLFDGTVTRSLTGFHGLPNNHVYAVAAFGGRTYAGTLGGLAEIDGRRVVRTLTTANSHLPHNWINGLAELDGRLFVGTYGGGVAAVAAGGELVRFEETAGLDVNPGAMLAAGGRLYVGTLAGGAYAYDAASGRWTRVAAALGSRNVTALAADEDYVYFGTENGLARVDRAALE